MPIVIDNVLNEIRSIAASGNDRVAKAKRLAEKIQVLGQYRWVGIYDVGAEIVSIISWSGPSAPKYPEFPMDKGLTGSAIQQKKTVVVGDVRKEPRYLTAFGNTLSEIIVPVLAPGSDRVIGTVDVESDIADAFSERDQQMIEHCAQAALPLWLLR
ncbi:MAG: GAF domain-containing protein [Candidatus Acidiferrales bacterium]